MMKPKNTAKRKAPHHMHSILLSLSSLIRAEILSSLPIKIAVPQIFWPGITFKQADAQAAQRFYKSLDKNLLCELNQ